jgi:hypothetical protein
MECDVKLDAIEGRSCLSPPQEHTTKEDALSGRNRQSYDHSGEAQLHLCHTRRITASIMPWMSANEAH